MLVACSVAVTGAQPPLSSSPASARPFPDAAPFLQQFRSTLQSDSMLLSRYTYREKRTEVRLNDEGEITGRSVKIVDVYAAAPGAESPSQREKRLGFGFLARFDKGSQVVLQRRKVGDAVWLPAEFRYAVGGRVLLVKKLRIEGLREYSDYRAAGRQD